jgi:hypothetical protein
MTGVAHSQWKCSVMGSPPLSVTGMWDFHPINFSFTWAPSFQITCFVPCRNGTTSSEFCKFINAPLKDSEACSLNGFNAELGISLSTFLGKFLLLVWEYGLWLQNSEKAKARKWFDQITSQSYCKWWSGSLSLSLIHTPTLILNHDPPYLFLLSRWDYTCGPLHPAWASHNVT